MIDIDEEINTCYKDLEKITKSEKRMTKFIVRSLVSFLICSCVAVVFLFLSDSQELSLIYSIFSRENILLLEIIAMAILLATIKVFFNSYSRLKKQLLLIEALEWFKTRTKEQQEVLIAWRRKI